MKNYLLFILFFTVVSLNAQFSGERERNLQLLAIEASEIVSNDAPLATREAMMVKLITNYLNAKNSTSVNTEVEKVVQNIKSDSKCDKARIGTLVKTFSQKGQNVLSDKYIASFGNVKTDCELKNAVKLYYLLGSDKVATKDICATLGCDKNDAIRMKSRGEKTYWKYTGEKKYVMDEEVFGWRYLCIEVTKDGIENLSNPEKTRMPERPESDQGDKPARDVNMEDSVYNAGTSTTNYTPVPDKEAEWKKEDMVDIWL